jgi:DNA repair exonuclease SbcCD ATPase subunit
MGATDAQKSRKSRAAAVASPPAEEGAAGDVANLGDLESVRSILFGAQIREFDRRIAKLEEQLVRSLETMRDTLNRRFDALEAFAKEEVGAVNKRLAAEQQQRTDGHEHMTGELRDLAKALKEQRAQLEEQVAESERSLRARLLDQAKSLTEDLQQKADALTALTERHVEELRTDKADRLALAELFDGVAMRLRELTIPDEE